MTGTQPVETRWLPVVRQRRGVAGEAPPRLLERVINGVLVGAFDQAAALLPSHMVDEPVEHAEACGRRFRGRATRLVALRVALLRQES